MSQKAELFITTAVNASNPKVIVNFNPLKTEFPLNYIYKFSPYLTGNTFRLHYKAQPVNDV
jgi:hypothetical protein